MAKRKTTITGQATDPPIDGVSDRLTISDVAAKVDGSYLGPRPFCSENWQPLVHLNGTRSLQRAFCSAASMILCLKRNPRRDRSFDVTVTCCQGQGELNEAPGRSRLLPNSSAIPAILSDGG